MRRYTLLCCAAVGAIVSFGVAAFAAADPPDFIRDYRFIPSQSTVIVTGGLPDYSLKLNIAGTFDLITGYNSTDPTPVAASSPPTLQPFAKFTDVHGVIYNPLSASPLPGWDLDKTLNLSGLTGTFQIGDPNQLFFLGADGNGEAFRLEADITGPWIHLTGGTTDPKSTTDPRYQVNALAHLLPFPDFNADGAITTADVTSMLTAMANPAQFETANSMSAADFTAMGDINGDGVVNNADLQALISMAANNASATGTGAIVAIPEPATAILAITGCAMSLVLVRRKAIAIR